MSLTIRPATPADLPALITLFVQDAHRRHATNPTLWALAARAPETLRTTLSRAMEAANPPVRQQWLLAETGGQPVGVTHSILLPVPPIYAGEHGPPGLIMEDCFVTDGAPVGGADALLAAAEADLIHAGAKIIVAASITGGAWEGSYRPAGYAPLTHYLAKTGLHASRPRDGIRPATEADVPGIVTASAENRQILYDLSPFWKPHPEANARFASWMHKSLSLPDRDMIVAETKGNLDGYAISQPATALHFPAAHDVAGIGFVDDFFHRDFTDPARLDGRAAAGLLAAAEAALQARGNGAALIVCPAAWRSKIDLLETAGYRTAITWYLKTAI